MFSWCYGIEEVRLPINLKSIAFHAFYQSELKRLELPSSVSKIEIGAFCFGPHEIVTKLPHDNGWFMEWPYNEKVFHDKLGAGVVFDMRGVYPAFEISVDFQGIIKTFFIPNDFSNQIRFDIIMKVKKSSQNCYWNNLMLVCANMRFGSMDWDSINIIGIRYTRMKYSKFPAESLRMVQRSQ